MIQQKQVRSEKTFEKRLLWIKMSFLGLFLIVFSFLLKIQVFNHPSENSGIYAKIDIPVPRGTIYDRNGKVLAMSIPYYSLYVDSWAVRYAEKKETSYAERLKNELSIILNMDPVEIEGKLQQKYPLIKKELSVEEYTTLRTANLPGTVFLPGYKRIYPNDTLACHVIGFAGTDGYGLEGIELYYNGFLQGKQGVSLILKDGSGELIRSVEKKVSIPEPGKDLYLTIDAGLQFIVEEEIENVYKKYNAASVSAIVINYESGEVLAMANMPNYNLNYPDRFSISDKRNRAVTDLFEPGSIFKIVTAAAAIEEGVISPDDIIDCENGMWFVRNHYLRDVHRYGRLTMEEVIEKSSNIGTVKIAMKLGEQKLYDYCCKFGFGMTTGIDLPGEIRGILRPLNKWSAYSITAIPIGQEVGINALQGIRAMAAIANGGNLINPYVLKEVKGDTEGMMVHKEKEKTKILSETTCNILRDILEDVTAPSGTAPLASIPGYSISGKTGTAQKIINGRYAIGRYVASFVGFLNNPEAKILILIKVDEPKPVYYGGVVAAPVFRNILWRSLQQKNIPPSDLLEDHKLAMKTKQ